MTAPQPPNSTQPPLSTSSRQPVCVTLAADERKFWCSCGLSQKQPFCDGAHKGNSDLRPIRLETTQESPMILCMCKETKTPPYCDGSHNSAV